VLYHIDRVESQYGNLMIRGWVSDMDPQEQTELSVVDDDGRTIPVYVERLVRPDVNAAVHKAPDYPSGIHILIDRAVVSTPNVWLTFTGKKRVQRVRIRVNESAVQRARKLRKLKRLAGKTSSGSRTVQKSAEWPLDADYDLWIRLRMPDARTRKEQRAHRFERMPLFSVVIPLYNTPENYLREVIDSVLGQTYPNVELCLADGSTDARVHDLVRRRYPSEPRIRYRRLKENRGISENTNAAIRMARGDFLVFADHDDVLAADALYEVAAEVNRYPNAEMIYTDEDKINCTGKAYFGPHFKPDFSMDLLCCNNYICHLLAVRRDLVRRAGLLDPAYDGAQDYDFTLRCAEKAKEIRHIPKVLYHWRTHPDSTAGNPASKEYAFEAGRRAVEAHYRRAGVDGSASFTRMRGRYRSSFPVHGEPLVSVLIPNKDHVEDMERCLSSIREKTTYRRYEILIIENNSVEAETEAFYRRLEAEYPQDVLRILRYEGAFNYSAIHNFAVPQARGEYLVLLNNDTEVVSPRWLEELLGLAQRPEVGAVGAKLYYPDGTIQHAGAVVGLCGPASHLFIGMAGDKDGYAGRLVSVQDYSAVTAACMMTKKSVYEKAGGMDETLAVAYNDIDYCMKLGKAGLHVLFTPYAELIHYESKTRGPEDNERKRARFAEESAVFCERWEKELEAGDPWYSPNLSIERTDCSLRLIGEREAWRAFAPRKAR